MERRVGDIEVKLGELQQWRRSTDTWMEEDRKEHKRMNDFMSTSLATQEAIREEQSRRHRSNSLKLSIIMACIAFGTLLMTVASFVAINWVSKHADATPLKILHSEQLPEVSSNKLQYAKDE